MVNISCVKRGLQHVGISSVRKCTQRMNPIRNSVGNFKQGSSDLEYPWAKARLQWITQYAIRLGTYKWNTKTMGGCPKHFDILKLGELETSHIGYWDEWHKEQEKGGVCGGKSEQVRFPRDEGGRLDADGKLAEEKTHLAIKYPEQGQYSFGVAAVVVGSEVIGQQAEPFIYLQQWIWMIKEWILLGKIGIKCIRDITSNTALGVTGQRTVSDGVFDCDLPIALHGVGEVLGEKFETFGCSTVEEIGQMMPAEITTFIRSTRGVT